MTGGRGRTSNLQPDRYERSALTVELRARPPLIARVLDLHPGEARARLVAARDALRDDPFEPHAQAWRNIASPCGAAMCSEKRSAGPAFFSAFCSIRRRPISSTPRRS